MTDEDTLAERTVTLTVMEAIELAALARRQADHWSELADRVVEPRASEHAATAVRWRRIAAILDPEA